MGLEFKQPHLVADRIIKIIVAIELENKVASIGHEHNATTKSRKKQRRFPVMQFRACKVKCSRKDNAHNSHQ